MNVLNKIRLLLFLTILSMLYACDKTCRVVKNTYKNGQEEVVYIYPDCNDTNNYSKHFFYENGQLMGDESFHNGKPEGKFKSWYENGKPEAEWEMKNGKEHGFIQCWYENGQKKKEGTLILGVKNGLQKTWFENGKQESEGRFINGRREGIWRYWLEYEQYKERNYINDTLNGATLEILEDKTKVLGQYKNGLETGLWIWKDSLGNLAQTAYYKNGVYDSIAVEYNPDGKIIEERIYKDGVIIKSKKY